MCSCEYWVNCRLRIRVGRVSGRRLCRILRLRMRGNLDIVELNLPMFELYLLMRCGP